MSTYILSRLQTVKDLGDGSARCLGCRDYPKVGIEGSLQDLDDQKTLAIGEPP